MADHKEEPVPESVMDKITEKFHGGDSSSSSSDSDDEKKGSSLPSAAEAMKAKIYRFSAGRGPSTPSSAAASVRPHDLYTRFVPVFFRSDPI
uniref:Dehydrin-like protein n=1 Tax=Zea mays TaxID=4577 RepID=Q8W2D9_MAIZE|nr:dehydrin-like protein [Zea mays]